MAFRVSEVLKEEWVSMELLADSEGFLPLEKFDRIELFLTEP